MILNNKLNFILSFILSLLNLIVLGVLFWSCDRGFDLSDESYYYLGYLFYDNNPDLHPAAFHMIFNRFSFNAYFTLIEIRIIRLILTVLASVVLFFGTKSILRCSSTAEKINLFNVVLCGMLLSYTWAPITLSYNTMSSILIALIVGFWFFLFSRQQVYSKAFLAFILGGLFSILFFVKITNVLLLPILIGITLYQASVKGLLKNRKPKFVLYYLLSFILGIYVFLAIISNEINLITIYQTIYSHIQESFGMLANDATHSTSYLLTRYYENAKMILNKLKYPLAFLTIFYFLLHFFWAKIKLKKIINSNILFKVIGIITLLLFIIQNSYWRGGTKVTYTMLIPYIFIGIFTYFNRRLETKNTGVVIILGLLSIPISGAVGTNNGLSAQILFYGAFIFLAIYYMVSYSKNNYYKSIILLIIVGLGASQIVYAAILYPYRQPSLTKSTHLLKDVATLGPLKVDSTLVHLKKELVFLEHIDSYYIFTYSPQRGMVLFTHKKPFSLEWFHENATEKICAIINKSKIDSEDIIFLLPLQAPLQKEVIQCMEQNGIFFEKNYSLAKSIAYYDQYYKKEIQLNIYIFSKKTH